MHQPQLNRHVLGHCRGTVAFTDVSGLEFGDFAGDEDICVLSQ